MTTQAAHPLRPLDRRQWLTLGLSAAVTAIAAVLIVQVIVLNIRPDLAAFAPLDSLARSAIFTLIPAAIATALFSWLAGRQKQPDRTFLRIAVIVLLISFIPDYVLPVPAKSFLASTATAFLHLVAAIAIGGILVMGYRRLTH